MGGVVLAKYITSGGSNLPKFTFPGDRRENFQFITKTWFNKSENKPYFSTIKLNFNADHTYSINCTYYMIHII